MAEQKSSEIRYLTPPSVDTKKKKYCRFNYFVYIFYSYTYTDMRIVFT